MIQAKIGVFGGCAEFGFDFKTENHTVDSGPYARKLWVIIFSRKPKIGWKSYMMILK
jgi:hypothetical protein